MTASDLPGSSGRDNSETQKKSARNTPMQNQFQAPAPTVETTICIVPPTETAEVESMQMPPNAQAITLLTKQAHNEARRRNKRLWGAIAALVAVDVAASFMIRVFKLDTLNTAGVIFLVPTMSVMFVLGGVAFRNILRPMGIDFAELARIGGRQSVPALMEAARCLGLQKDHIGCQSALTACLPQLQATDAALLTARDRKHLNEVLKRLGTYPECQPEHTAYALAILKAYEQVGDANAIPVVTRLADMTPRNEHQRSLKQAAQECLLLLRARISSLEPEQTLLRASASPTSAPDTLLRAATSATNAHEEELLRAAECKDVPSV